MKLVNLGIDDEKAVSLAMEQFPSLKEGPAQPHRDTDLKEFTQFITKRPMYGSWKQALAISSTKRTHFFILFR